MEHDNNFICEAMATDIPNYSWYIIAFESQLHPISSICYILLVPYVTSY